MSLAPRLVTLAVFAVSVVACAPPPAPPPPPPAPVAAPAVPAPPDKVAVETGKDCVKADATCGGGLCTVEIKNGCDQPVSCDVGVRAACKTDAELVEASGRGRGTILPKSDSKLAVAADCTRGVVMTTAVKEVRCR